jgi:hypothetical protein
MPLARHPGCLEVAQIGPSHSRLGVLPSVLLQTDHHECSGPAQAVPACRDLNKFLESVTDDERRRQFRSRIVLILATPVASWWLIGDLTNRRRGNSPRRRRAGLRSGGEARPRGDRSVGASPASARRGLAWLAWAQAAVWIPDGGACCYRLLGPASSSASSGSADRRGNGANIGAGLTIFGGPILAVLLIAAAVAAWHILRSRARRNGSCSG